MLLGVVVCLNIEDIRRFVSWLLSTNLFAPELYYLSRLPADIDSRETVAVVINAAIGIEPMAVRMMAHAAARQLDRLIIVNKIDSPDADLAALLIEIQTTFGRECLAVNLPDAGATRVIDCFYNRAGHSDFGTVDEAHRALVEQVVDVDEAMLDRYLNDGDIDPAELHGVAADRPPFRGVR